MLVEVLAALVVTAALVGVALPFAGRLIARWQAGGDAMAEADGWMQVLARVTDDLAQAVPVVNPGAAPALLFTVEPKRVAFARPAFGHGSPGGGGLDRVTYRVEPVAGGERLVRVAEPLAGSGAGSTAVLVGGPYRFAFAAVGREGAATPWAGRTDVPVRLELRVTGNPALRAPVALPVAARATVAAVVPTLRRRVP